MQTLAYIRRIPDWLRRPTRSTRFIPQLDGLRFLAITSVIVAHLITYTKGKVAHAEVSGSWLAGHAENFARGVELFFCISGFIISLPFIRARDRAESVDLGSYYLRRLTRLEPPFILAMCIMLAARVLGRGESLSALAAPFLATITYSHGPIFGAKSVISFVTWSLEIEVQFYLLAPFILRAVAPLGTRVRLAALLLIAVACLGFHELFVPGLPRLWAFLPSYLPFFLGGVFVAELVASDQDQPRKSSVLWDFVGVATLPLILLSSIHDPLGRLTLTAACPLLLVASYRSRFVRAVLSNRWLTAIGGMCYSIYLLHELVVWTCGPFTTRLSVTREFWPNLSLQFALLFPVITVGCALFYVCIEKPCMNPDWFARLTRGAWRRSEPSRS